MPIRIEEKPLITAACKFFSVTESELKSNSLDREIVKARRIVMSLLNIYCGYSSPVVGKMFNRDHSTVIKAKRSFEKALCNDAQYRTRYNEFFALLSCAS